jgi:hypothetical protein
LLSGMTEDLMEVDELGFIAVWRFRTTNLALMELCVCSHRISANRNRTLRCTVAD